MNRFRQPQFARSKAPPSTVCQKCLKRGHYSYECTISAADRPYIARPSRTQQLQNPKLLPKLSSDVPNERLRQKGVADEQLAQKALERARHRSRSPQSHKEKRRSRSPSVSSATSVSTISTNQSRSRSPTHSPNRHDSDDYMTSQRPSKFPSVDRMHRKRRRGSSSGHMSSDDDLAPSSHHDDRNTRRRRASTSPHSRGRRRSRSRDSERRSWRRSSSRSRGNSRRRRSASRGRHRPKAPERDRRDESLSRSPVRRTNKAHSPERYHKPAGRQVQPEGTRPPPPKERSLSPYSRRIALTQAMNRGGMH
ncbi:hypothetical protein P152DRAFT_461058 [Eremomyces bilateralis CBS 781.70]|uniref:Zinc knuckle-domain-containing protein n=1 Tax=Eremomyces bilateralis CBS 781.70 TaxID=1392243 RepID=A0A6G1FW74_9PEZI|nr:uncharacterized protein P152DRAFT_461058 [Eremomyces bilateralis CBS 781.70]KAF1809978.1 hypothetical protein P152DRAFT_461058 [Eremomyces bilateralis CBS 781.70]